MAGYSGYEEETFLGSGEVYFDLLDSSGNKTGEIDFGEASLFSLSAPSLEKKELIGHRQATYAETIKSVITKREQDIKLTGHDFNKNTLALGMLGTGSVYTQTAGDNTASPESVTAYADKWSDLSYRRLDPENAPVVQDATDTITYTEDTDYEIDYDSGRILILSSGSISDEDVLHIGSTWLAITSGFKVLGGTSNNIEAQLRLVGYDQANERNFEVIAYKAQLEPAGDMNFLSEEFGAVELNGKMLSTTDGIVDVFIY